MIRKFHKENNDYSIFIDFSKISKKNLTLLKKDLEECLYYIKRFKK